MGKRKVFITNKKERAVLSDVLPYETPATFSNRYFYHFLINYDIRIENHKIKWRHDNSCLKEIIKLLFGLEQKEIESEGPDYFKLNRNGLKTIPFHYKISHKRKEFRELTIIHPKNQLALIEFYNDYKELILYYNNISNFSLRKTHKPAKFSYFKDNLHYKKLACDHETQSLEEYDKEYENLKTFFSYKEISNINKFYESFKYHRCEKKYNSLYKFDISKCFDSIYSHSISWAVLNRDAVKEAISLSSETFGGKFDKIMQDLNYGETNGIVIGPEFSRIFAEIILQQIDRKVQLSLANKSNPLIFRKDYEIFRYVDDYFIFYNKEAVRDEIIRLFRINLKTYKLGLNEEKSEQYEKPILTGITKAKVGIVKLLDKKLKVWKDDNEKTSNPEDKGYKISLYVSSNKLITEFKIILDTSGITYKNIQNYALGCIDNKVVNLIELYTELEDQKEVKIINSLIEILDFTFFVFSVTPRVNSTIKLAAILSKVIKFAKNYLSEDLKHHLFKKIYDEIFLVLNKNKIHEDVQIETLYLLIVLKELGKDYRIDQKVLCSYLGINLENKRCDYALHYFSLTVILFYIGNKIRYKTTKQIIQRYICMKIEEVTFENRKKDTELILLFFDLISCPYLNRKFKNKLFDLFGINFKQGRLRSEIINFERYWFTKWDDFNFGKELEAKKSQEVY